MARRRTQVTATIFDVEGFAFICFKGNPQDVADAASIYVMNVANPLGGHTYESVELIRRREEREEEES